MKCVLVDTSVWIDFFNGTVLSEKAELLQSLIKEDYDISICPVIYQEILQGIKDDSIYKEIKKIINNFTMLDIDIMEVTDTAIELYRSLRKKGVTIRKSNDCLIASYSIIAKVPVLHKDRDFDIISRNSRLNLFNI